MNQQDEAHAADMRGVIHQMVMDPETDPKAVLSLVRAWKSLLPQNEGEPEELFDRDTDIADETDPPAV